MEINKNRFYFGKTKRGKKFHIFPVNYTKSLCILISLSKVQNGGGTRKLNKDICKVCIEEYRKVKDSASFAMFVG